MMKDSSSSSNIKEGKQASTFVSGAVSAAHTGGITVTPRVLAHRLDPEMVASSMSHGVIGSDVTLGGLDISEKEKKLKEKKKAYNRISKLFQREGATTTVSPDTVIQMGPKGPMARAAVMPSKGGVLSNLLKLQGNNRHHKVRVSSVLNSESRLIEGFVLEHFFSQIETWATELSEDMEIWLEI